MIQSNEIFIPIPKTRNTHCKVEINGTDMSARVIESRWVKPCTSGIGTFFVRLSNAHGQLNGNFEIGQAVKFYADNSNATKLQFWGRIDYIKNNLSDSGQFLEIEGRHRAYLLNEFMICYSATATTTSHILNDIIDKLPASYGFTKTNIATTTDSMNVEWNYKPFWDCVVDISNYAGYDCYVDDNLDFHYFAENSIANSKDAIVEGDNFIKTEGWGTDNTYEKTRVTVIGQDDEGIPIIYTAKIANETDIKEVFVRDSSANTSEKVQNMAEAKLAELTNRNPQATMRSYGLEDLNPGDNIWLIIPRQQIAGQYKIIQITHLFGMESGGWRTDCVVEEDAGGITRIIQRVNEKTDLISNTENANKFNYSYNFSFDTDSGIHSATEITGGILKTNGAATGTWISPTKNIEENTLQYELRVAGESIPGTSFYVSSDEGNTWQEILAQRTLYDMSPPGKNLKLKVIFASASTQIKSLALFYS